MSALLLRFLRESGPTRRVNVKAGPITAKGEAEAMTINILTPMRHAVEGGATGLIAAPQVPSIDHWNALVRAYLEARSADEIEREFGAVAKAEQAHDAAKAGPDAKVAYAAYAAAEDAHTANFGRPRWDAASAVVRTPSPNMAALVQKIEVMEGEDWDGNQIGAEDDFAALAADIRRLAQGA